MDRNEQRDRGHEHEVHEARALEAPEGRRHRRELHGLPDRETREQHHQYGEAGAEIEDLLHCVVLAEPVVKLECRGGSEVAQGAIRQKSIARPRESLMSRLTEGKEAAQLVHQDPGVASHRVRRDRLLGASHCVP